MKKYLMIGFAAIAMASCTNHDFETMSQEEYDQYQIQQSYNKAFVEGLLDGKAIASNQDWGFGATTRAFTRAAVATPSVEFVGQTYNAFMTSSYNSAIELAQNWVNANWIQEINYNDSRYVAAKPWHNAGWADSYYQITASVVTSDISAEQQKAYYDAVIDKVPEGQNNISKAQSTGYALTTKGGEVTVTPIFHNSNSDDKVSYYYYPAGTTPDVKTLPKYTIGQLGNEGAMLKTYSLVYVDENDKASYTFPPNYVICFMISNMSSSSTNESILTKGAGDYEEVYLTYPKAPEYYGDGAYNQEIHTVNGWAYTPVNTPHAAVFSTTNLSFVGFEDWNDMDYNDLIFAVGGTTGGETIEIPEEEPSEDVLRIIAEDLSASGASDFDFNDVVLDVTYATETTPAKVMLVAAGGTLQLKVGSTNGVGGVEVHEKLLGAENAKKGEVYKMVSPGGDVWPVAAVDITSYLSDTDIRNAADANEKIRIEVYKQGASKEYSWNLLTAPKGEPACKLAVDNTFEILRERQSIKGECPLFVKWATDNNFTSKWWTMVTQ